MPVLARGGDLFAILRSANFIQATTSAGGGAGSTASFASRQTLARTQAAPRQLRATVAAAGSVIPVVYGRTRIGARIAQAVAQANELTLLCVLGIGPFEGIDAVLVNEQFSPPGVIWEFFNGAPDQAVSATLTSKIPGWSSTLTGTRGGVAFGVAYAVVRIPASAVAEGFPVVEFIVRGKHVYDPRTMVTGYSTNPVLALRDFAASSLYGAGLALDEAAFSAAADVADSFAAGERLRTLGLALEAAEPPARWLEVLATYAGVFLSLIGDTVSVVPDWTATPGAEIGPGQILDGTFRLRAPSRRDVPTAVSVQWSDPATGEESTATDYAPGVDAASARESVIRLPGITSAAEALRTAGIRRRTLALGKFIADWTMPDEALSITVGDVRPVTHPVLTAAGIAPHTMRVTDIQPGAPGRWRITARTYDPAVYVATTPPDEPPTAPDTDMPISSTRYTSTTSITAPAAAILMEYEITAGGGGGEGGVENPDTTTRGGGGGGGGQTVRGRWPVTAGAGLTVTIGAGGPGGAPSTPGTDGGDTTITGGGLEGVIARGGQGGGFFATGGGYGDDVAGSDGGAGGNGGLSTGSPAGAGGGSGRYVGGAAGSTAATAGGGGGASANGPGGTGGSGGSGGNGSAPGSGYGGGGGGGGGGSALGAGAAGRSGVAIVTFW